MGDDDLPSISMAEANAIAAFVAWTLKFKEGLQKNNKDML
jgi:hypothetical protein